MHSIKFGGGGFRCSSRNFLVIYILRYAYSTQWLDFFRSPQFLTSSLAVIASPISRLGVSRREHLKAKPSGGLYR
jgi:hypothetical protein